MLDLTMYKLLVLFLYVTVMSCLKQRCQEQSRLFFLIDSTNDTTQYDFGVQVEIVRYVINEFESSKLTLSVQVYDQNDRCLLPKNGFPSPDGFYGLSDPSDMKLKLNILQHTTTNQSFNLQCALGMLPHVPMMEAKENTFGIILAKYQSIKSIIDRREHSKFKPDGNYFVALMYSANKTRVDVFARRASNIVDMIPAVMQYACPSYAPESTGRITLSVTKSTLIKKHTVSMSPERRTTQKQISSTEQTTPLLFHLPSKIVASSSKILFTSSSARLLATTSLDMNTGSMYRPESMTSLKRSTVTDKKYFTSALSNISVTLTSVSYKSSSTVVLTPTRTSNQVLSSSNAVNTTKVSNGARFSPTPSVTTVNPTIYFSGMLSILPSSYHSTKKSHLVSQLTRTSSNLKNMSTSIVYTNLVKNSTVTMTTRHITLATTMFRLPSITHSCSASTFLLSTTLAIPTLYSQQATDRISGTVSTGIFNQSSTLPQIYSSMTLSSSAAVMSIDTRNMTSSIPFKRITGRFPISLHTITSSMSSKRRTKHLSLSAARTQLLPKTRLNIAQSVTSSLSTRTKSNIAQSVTSSPSTKTRSNIAQSVTPSPSTKTRSNIAQSVTPSTRTKTRSNIAQSVTPSPSTKAIVSSTVMVIPPWKKLSTEIDEFIKQNITTMFLKDKQWVKEFINKSSKLLNNISHIKHYKPIKERSIALLEYFEKIFLKVGQHLPAGKVLKQQEQNLVVEIIAVDTITFNGYRFSHNNKNNDVTLPATLFHNISSDKAIIVSMVYRTLPTMKSSNEYFKTADDIISVSVEPFVENNLVESPLAYRLQVTENQFSGYKCVFWNASDWDSTGCVVSMSNKTTVTCECNHMTSFSILMQVKEFEISPKHQFILSLITYIGCGASITACLLLILSYMMCGRLVKIDRNIIHINLALAIAISNGLFIVADSVFKYQHICFAVSVAMFYTYLASFFWMLVEGIHVYLMIIKVFKSPRKMKVYLIIGWILPAVIVTLTAFKFHEHFTRDDFCWLSIENDVIWAFVGPALSVLIVNSVILIATLNASHKMSVEETEFSKLQRIARLTLLLMPIFGLTWIFGILAVNKQVIIFQYVFVGINSFQGVFIFVCYCLLNNEVKREYQRVRRKSQYSSSKSNVASENGFTTYIHPYQRRRLKSALSMEDSLAAVQLTKYDTMYPAYYTPADASSETFSDTLTKRLKKQYSIELLQLQQNGGEEDDTRDVASVCSLLPRDESNYNFCSSTCLELASNNDKLSSTTSDVLDENTPYKTFRNVNDGLVLKAYQV